MGFSDIKSLAFISEKKFFLSVNSDLSEYLKREPDVMRSEVNIDPTAEYDWVISQRSSNREGFDTKYTAHFAAYDPDESGQNDAQFYFEKSWYDTPPDQVNFEDLFDL